MSFPRRITKRTLEEQDACAYYTRKFNKLFPNGVTVSKGKFLAFAPQFEPNFILGLMFKPPAEHECYWPCRGCMAGDRAENAFMELPAVDAAKEKRDKAAEEARKSYLNWRDYVRAEKRLDKRMLKEITPFMWAEIERQWAAEPKKASKKRAFKHAA